MTTLFIDTHDENLYLAIKTDANLFINTLTSSNHSEIVIPELQDLLKKSNLTLNDIDEIIVVNGPGSFTGTRIGVTIAKTIAYSLNIKIKTISSLEALGVSDNSLFDIIFIEDSKGCYYAKKNDKKYEEFNYLKKEAFDTFIKSNNYSISSNKNLNLDAIIDYVSDKPFINPHSVNPIYIKEIDVLK